MDLTDEHQADSASSSLSTPRRQHRVHLRSSSSMSNLPEIVDASYHIFVDPQETKETESWVAYPRSRLEASPGIGSSRVTHFSGIAINPDAGLDSVGRRDRQGLTSRATCRNSSRDLAFDLDREARSDLKRNFDMDATLLWRDLTVKLEGKRGQPYKAIQGLTGYALPSTITAFLGPPDSGKSSLLRALAGDLPFNAKVYGEILLNGHPTNQLTYKIQAYVRKETQLVESLTVWETLLYSAFLRLPSSWSFSEKTAVVNRVMADLHLENFASTVVGGSWGRKDLPLGERRRLIIALELMTGPRLIFMEQPVAELDSISGFLVMACLKKLAIGGCTVVITAEQTCLEISNLFDKVALLFKGKTIFFGEISECLEHFETAGFPRQEFQNPVNHFLHMIHWADQMAPFHFLRKEFEHATHPLGHPQTSIIARTLETAYKASSNAAAVENLVMHLSKQEFPVWHALKHATVFTQLVTLTWRSFLNKSRDFKFYWLRFTLYVVLMLCIGTIYYNVGASLTSIHMRASAIFSTVSFLSLLAIGSFPALEHELQVYKWERKSRHNGPLIFVISSILSSIPFLFLIAAMCSAIGYFLMGFQPALGLFMYFVVTIFLCLAFAEGLLIVIASIIPAVFEGMLLATCLQVLTFLAGGYFRKASDLPKPVWRYPASYIAYQTYAVEGLLLNEYDGVNFSVDTLKHISGEEAIRSANPNSSASNGKWFTLSILAALAVGSWFLLYLTLIIKETIRAMHQKGRTSKVFC